MSVVVARAARSPAPWSWAQHAVVHVHCMSPWWSQLHSRPRPRRVRQRGNVAFLPAPIAGYRIRHHAGGSTVEMKCSHAPATELWRCDSAAAARSALAVLSASHNRPFLGEIGEASA